MERESLASKTVEAVLNGRGADADSPADSSEAHGAAMAIEEVAIIDNSFGIVIEGKGL